MFPVQCTFDCPPIFEPDLIIEDLSCIDNIINDPVPEHNKKKQKRPSKNSCQNKDKETIEPKTKKIVHRNTERQRRQEMNNLYNSLRSLLPLEYIKGKRSISDHMHEGVKYIKHMEEKLKELKMRRDDLSNKSTNSSSETQNRRPNNPQNSVTVSPCLDGVEILITLCLDGGEIICLSKILALLIESGLNVISCVSTNANERQVYRIQSQDNGVGQTDLAVLQARLAYAINAG